MYDGTLGSKGPWQALVTFQQLIILADQHGTVDMTADAIARRTTIPLEVITVGIAALEQEDPDSRTPDEAGRRIVRLSNDRPWGWRIVNYAHYRQLRSNEERRVYQRQYWRDNRSPTAKSAKASTAAQQNSTDSTDAVSSKQYAVSSKEKPPARSNGGKAVPNLRVKGERLYAEILTHRVTNTTPNGSRSHIPKEFLDTLPLPAQRAFKTIGGAAAAIDAEGDPTGRRVLQGKFGLQYELECSSE